MNTRNKRSSAVNPGSPWRGMWPDPEGTIAADDRAQLAYLYGGIEIEESAAPEGDVFAWYPGDTRLTRFEPQEELEQQPFPVPVVRRKRRVIVLDPYVVDIPGLPPLPDLSPVGDLGPIPEIPEPVPTVAQVRAQGRDQYRQQLHVKAWQARQMAQQKYQQYAMAAMARKP